MSDKINAGGFAFPHSVVESDGQKMRPLYTQTYHQGMTLRDYFAGLALQGLLAYPSDSGSMKIEDWVDLSYKYADAMIKRRAQ